MCSMFSRAIFVDGLLKLLIVFTWNLQRPKWFFIVYCLSIRNILNYDWWSVAIKLSTV